MKETMKTINQNRAASIRNRVMQLAGYTEEQVNQLMFDIAIDYMKSLGMDEQWLSTWLKEPLFWGWWRQQWMLIDEIFWYKYAGNQGRDNVKAELRKRYEKLHRSIDKFPDEIVYNKIHNSYNEVGEKLFKKIRSENKV